MNYNINSSGLYDVNVYNLIATNATVLSSLTVNGSTLATNTNVNNLSTTSTLSITNLNNTSTTIFNNLNSLSTNSSLNISNLQATTTTTFNNLNDFSRFSWLNIDSLNDNTNNLSNYVYSNVPANYNRIVSLSTYSVLTITNLQATSTTIFNNLNSLSTNSNLSITSLNNKTNFSNLLVSNASTLLSSLNVSGTTRLNNTTTINSTLDVVNKTTTQDVQVRGVLTLPVNNWIIDNNANVSNNQRMFFDSGAKTYFKSGGTSTTPLLDGFIFRNGQAGTDLLNIDGLGNSTQLGTLLVNGITCMSSLNVSGTTTLNRIITYNNTFPPLTAVNNATTHSIISIFPGVNGQQGGLTADLYNIYLSSFAYGTGLSGPQPYITVNATTLFNLCNTKVTLQAYGYATTGGNQGARIILNGGNNGGSSISFTNDSTTTCVMNSSGVGIGITNPNCRLYISSNLAASATVYAMRLSCGASTDGGGFGTLLGLGSEPNGWSKCAIGHTRTGPYDQGDIVFLTRATGDTSDCTMSDVKMRITSAGNVACTGSISCNSISLSNACIVAGNVGIKNSAPWVDLNLGNVAVGGSSGSLVFGKNNGAGGIRNFRQGMSSNFFFCIGDCGNVNNDTAVWTLQMALSYQAPASSFTISSSGQLIVPGGYATSDERIKTNIKTIENALEKTLLLRGVEYNNFKIDPDKKCLGLIAQEVELIIPEVVDVNEMDNIKCISYNSLIGVLIEAIKQQQQQINELKLILKNNNLN